MGPTTSYHAIVTLSLGLMATSCLPQATETSVDVEPTTPSQSADMSGMEDASALDASSTLDASFTTDQDAPLDVGVVDDRDLSEDMGAAQPDQARDMPALDPEHVPVLVGVGHFGRRIISCDAGQSWQEAAHFWRAISIVWTLKTPLYVMATSNHAASRHAMGSARRARRVTAITARDHPWG